NYGVGSSAQLINDGLITVEGKIAGPVSSSSDNHESNRGLIDIKSTAQTAITIKSFNTSSGSSIFTSITYDVIAYQLRDMQNNVLNIRGLYQIHSEEVPWTTDITFIDSLGNQTIITQTAFTNYVLPEWFDIETMSIFTSDDGG